MILNHQGKTWFLFHFQTTSFEYGYPPLDNTSKRDCLNPLTITVKEESAFYLLASARKYMGEINIPVHNM